MSDRKDVAHGIQAGRLPACPERRLDGAARIDCAVVGAMHQLDALALPREDDRMVADDGAAVLVITHDIASMIASGVCDSLAVMRRGRIVAQNSPHRVRQAADEHTQKLFTGVPR